MPSVRNVGFNLEMTEPVTGVQLRKASLVSRRRAKKLRGRVAPSDVGFVSSLPTQFSWYLDFCKSFASVFDNVLRGAFLLCMDEKCNKVVKDFGIAPGNTCVARIPGAGTVPTALPLAHRLVEREAAIAMSRGQILLVAVMIHESKTCKADGCAAKGYDPIKALADAKKLAREVTDIERGIIGVAMTDVTDVESVYLHGEGEVFFDLHELLESSVGTELFEAWAVANERERSRLDASPEQRAALKDIALRRCADMLPRVVQAESLTPETREAFMASIADMLVNVFLVRIRYMCDPQALRYRIGHPASRVLLGDCWRPCYRNCESFHLSLFTEEDGGLPLSDWDWLWEPYAAKAGEFVTRNELQARKRPPFHVPFHFGALYQVANPHHKGEKYERLRANIDRFLWALRRRHDELADPAERDRYEAELVNGLLEDPRGGMVAWESLTKRQRYAVLREPWKGAVLYSHLAASDGSPPELIGIDRFESV